VFHLLRYLDERPLQDAPATVCWLIWTTTDHRCCRSLDWEKSKLPDDPFLLRNPLVQAQARIADLTTDTFGQVTSGTISIPYGVGGLAEPLVLHLGDNPGSTPFRPLPVNGSVKVAEGNLEMT
jgi:hypothetical protein